MEKTFARTHMPGSEPLFINRHGKRQNPALVSDAREYRFEDVWGDVPCSTPCAIDKRTSGIPETSVIPISEPRQSWIGRILRLLEAPETASPDEALDFLPGSQPSSNVTLLRRARRQLLPKFREL